MEEVVARTVAVDYGQQGEKWEVEAQEALAGGMLLMAVKFGPRSAVPRQVVAGLKSPASVK